VQAGGRDAGRKPRAQHGHEAAALELIEQSAQLRTAKRVHCSHP
jgi:hypothetical protein